MDVVADIKAESKLESDELWFKDAIIYQLHVKAFADSNNDGIGDFAGLTEKLDYLEDLGITALWLLPFYPSPGRDDGYDISDYRTINADLANRVPMHAIGMCGAIPIRPMREPASSLTIPKNPIGPGTPSQGPTIGIVSFHISPISITTIRACLPP